LRSHAPDRIHPVAYQEANFLGMLQLGCLVILWFAKTLSDSDFNKIQGCRPQAKCDSTLGWSTPFGYS